MAKDRQNEKEGQEENGPDVKTRKLLSGENRV